VSDVRPPPKDKVCLLEDSPSWSLSCGTSLVIGEAVFLSSRPKQRSPCGRFSVMATRGDQPRAEQGRDASFRIVPNVEEQPTPSILESERDTSSKKKRETAEQKGTQREVGMIHAAAYAKKQAIVSTRTPASRRVQSQRSKSKERVAAGKLTKQNQQLLQLTDDKKRVKYHSLTTFPFF